MPLRNCGILDMLIYRSEYNRNNALLLDWWWVYQRIISGRAHNPLMLQCDRCSTAVKRPKRFSFYLFIYLFIYLFTN